LDIHFAEQNEARWYSLEKKRKEVCVGKAFEILRKHKVEPILIKGLVSALPYPPNVPRYFADIDLAVSARDYLRISELSNSQQLNNLSADFHRELRHLDSVPWVDLLNNSLTVDFDGTPVRILRPEDHLRVVCVHWLTDGGAREERLLDIFYAVQNRPDNFDWTRCLDIVSPTRRQWIITAIGIAHHYLDLCVDDLPFVDEIHQMPSWIRRCLEREWRAKIQRNDVPPLRSDPKGFLQQVLKRIPPNPISATIECEGEMGQRLPFRYQAWVFFRFIKTGFKFLGHSLFHPRRSHS